MALSDYKTRQQLGDLGPIPYSTLKKLAMGDDGPPFIRIGDRVYYHVPSYEKWLESFLGVPVPPKAKRGRPSKLDIANRRRQAATAASTL